MTIVITILAAILVFGVVIFFHELGHFVMAKRAGIKVNEFALGMGPTLFKFGKGETKYALRLLPIGGFVSMEGEDEESSDERSFQHASIPRRISVTIAGAVMNLILGFLVLMILIVFGRSAITSREVAQVDPSSTSGLQVGDVIEKVGGRKAFTFDDLEYEFARTQNGAFDIEVLRDGQHVLLEDVVFKTVTVTDPETGEPLISRTTGEPYEYMDLGFKVYPIQKTFGSVLKETAGSTISNARFIYLNLFDLVTGKLPLNNLSGPVGIVSAISEAVSFGWQPVLNLLALISINLGVVNMLPLPALDGGRTLLLIIEGIRKKPIPQKYEIALNVAGFALLMLLMVVISFNDIRKLF